MSSDEEIERFERDERPVIEPALKEAYASVLRHFLGPSIVDVDESGQAEMGPVTLAQVTSMLDCGAAIGITELRWMAEMMPEFVIKVAGRWPFKRYPPGVQRRFKRWSRKYQQAAMEDHP